MYRCIYIHTHTHTYIYTFDGCVEAHEPTEHVAGRVHGSVGQLDGGERRAVDRDDEEPIGVSYEHGNDSLFYRAVKGALQLLSKRHM